MVAYPPWATPHAWTNQDTILYHGTLDVHADDILNNGVLAPSANSLTRTDADFGAGFYATTLMRQARDWANVRAASASAGLTHNPGVVEFRVSRDELAALDCLSFVRWEFDAEDFWSLAFHCRGGGSNHCRPAAVKNGWYDVVVGPVATSWQRRVVLRGSDQISFHTNHAVRVLNRAQRRRII